jgi:hypothetical protein
LLIAMSALEIGLKHHIAAIIPATTWLLEELPAPPSNRLLAEYLPLLHSAGGSFFTTEQIALVKKGIAQRNKVTHAGGGVVSADFLERLLELIRTVLRTLDALAGHEWALVEAPAARAEDYPPREK